MESNSVCIPTSDKQNQTTVKQESDLFHPEYDYKLNWMTQSPVTN